MTSPTPSEGKSTTISNLAITFAQAGKRVLLVDADLRRPSIDTAFKLKKGDGLSELLLGRAKLAEVVRKTDIENLSIITSGAIPANPAEILGSEKMRDFIEDVKKQYEMILFDSSPVLAVTDPSVLSTQTDGSIIVVSAGKTRVQELEQATELLEGVGGKVIGVVINNFDLHHAYGISYRRAKSGAYGYGSMYYTKKDAEQGVEQVEHHHKS
jgi:tyrosine-protein kinase Etk/Wzc